MIKNKYYDKLYKNIYYTILTMEESNPSDIASHMSSDDAFLLRKYGSLQEENYNFLYQNNLIIPIYYFSGTEIVDLESIYNEFFKQYKKLQDEIMKKKLKKPVWSDLNPEVSGVKSD